MYTHCPHCDTYFRISSEQIKSANGDVRCGRCFGSFNAIKNLADEPPTTTDDSPASPAKEIADNVAENTSPPAEAVVKNRQSKAEESEQTHSQQIIEEFHWQATAQPEGKRLVWTLLSLPLLALLGLQYVYYNLDQLAQNSQYRPALSSLCSVTGCELPLFKSPQQIELTHRDIRAHDKKKDVLVVKAVIINQADITQAFPIMQLSMQDITGHTMAGRRFLPSEYLVDTTSVNTGIGAQQSQQIQLELIDPGKEAVGFEFDFM
ncbi:MAG TPA: DUF3426 domain-containing protein [Candidatus Tenderia electrophaga]|uniref:DUF3426 domain-containing protein n=1 Tax=Candidatus Tenderia electrophaga TaxID=1748243 RepID=A0A832N4V1_9GAMM|nr:DUF3426 domain-containing protein [Candidatus Tenderia electrophaga]